MNLKMLIKYWIEQPRSFLENAWKSYIEIFLLAFIALHFHDSWAFHSYKDRNKNYAKAAEKDSQTYIFRSKLGVSAVCLWTKIFCPPLYREFSSRERSWQLVIFIWAVNMHWVAFTKAKKPQNDPTSSLLCPRVKEP